MAGRMIFVTCFWILCSPASGSSGGRAGGVKAGTEEGFSGSGLHLHDELATILSSFPRPIVKDEAPLMRSLGIPDKETGKQPSDAHEGLADILSFVPVVDPRDAEAPTAVSDESPGAVSGDDVQTLKASSGLPRQMETELLHEDEEFHEAGPLPSGGGLILEPMMKGVMDGRGEKVTSSTTPPPPAKDGDVVFPRDSSVSELSDEEEVSIGDVDTEAVTLDALKSVQESDKSSGSSHTNSSFGVVEDVGEKESGDDEGKSATPIDDSLELGEEELDPLDAPNSACHPRNTDCKREKLKDADAAAAILEEEVKSGPPKIDRFLEINAFDQNELEDISEAEKNEGNGFLGIFRRFFT